MHSTKLLLLEDSGTDDGDVVPTGPGDVNVARALDKLHDCPAHGWTLRELARQSGVSRSVLAERFVHLVGVPPMRYLAAWRMLLTAMLLSTTSLKLAEIAAQVGYGSEAALSRAYKRWAGIAPSGIRRASRTLALAG